MVKEDIERYSFSKLSSFYTCKYGYQLRYIEGNKGIGNAFSSYGSFVHELMEGYAKGETALSALPDIYEWEFDDKIPEKFPYNKYVDLRESYYNQGLEFLKNFEGYDGIEILGVEKEFELPIDDWMFVGVIDLIYRDETGIVIKDYKSKGAFKNKTELFEYSRQLYLYSMYIKEQYGEFPSRIEFLMFRKNTPIKVPFDIEAYNEAISWAKNAVSEIRECWDFEPKCDEFYAQNLCNHREYCKYKQYKKKRRRK